eukprot:TRINITY_DN7683_c0_g1_i1.p2 TRINITY_DN7683_c0_g1~~TRINITY_DN7683_c0_g1_i1.p2  ORF type:complete len:132 (+),score=20.70 TRINITY_DN7683_c0_g1_i1:436-831(+)
MSNVVTPTRLLSVIGSMCGLAGFAVWWNETSPLGWWTLKPKTRDEREMASYYERRVSPFPGDTEAVAKWIAEKGAASSIVPPKPGRPRSPTVRDAQLALQEARVEREAEKLWMRMRREAQRELREQGLEVN